MFFSYQFCSRPCQSSETIAGIQLSRVENANTLRLVNYWKKWSLLGNHFLKFVLGASILRARNVQLASSSKTLPTRKNS